MPLPSLTKIYHHEPYPAIAPTREELSAQGKVVLIAGAGSGVGAASAVVFAKAGARAIALLGRRKDSLVETSKRVKKANPSTVVEIYSVDISEETGVASCLTDFVEAHGLIDVCINSAAYLSDKATIQDGNLADFWASFEIGVKGAFILAQNFLRNCSKTGAVIVGINSLIAHMPASQVEAAPASYASNKIAAAKLFEYIAAENPHIRSYSVHPGVIETDMAKKSVDMMPPGPNPFLPWDSVDLPACFVLWLSSPEGSSIPSGRYLWSNWDVTELKECSVKLFQNPLELTMTLPGWPFPTPPSHL